MKIKTMEDPKAYAKKYTYQNNKKSRILLKKRDNSKPSKYKWELKLEEEPVDKFDELNKSLNKKPKKVNVSPIQRNKSLNPVQKKDYLRELATQKDAKNDGGKNDLFDAKEKKKKWNKEVNNNNGTTFENIYNVKEKANVLEQKAEMTEKLLKLNGGIENNPELGRKISSLLIDSIEAKLSILNKVNENA